MFFTSLELLNFKNLTELKVDFSSGINCIVGENGVGKTNILDALYLLSFTKSAIVSTDSALVTHGDQFMMAKGKLTMGEDPQEVLCSIRPRQKKF